MRRRLFACGGAVSLTLAAAVAATPAASRAQGHTDADFAALNTVCSRCHTLELVVAQPRSETEWMGILQKMADLGARGTDEQYDAIVHYLRTHLTAINVNEASADELIVTLGLPQEVAESMVARRQVRPFRDLADLESVPGVGRAAIEARKGRIFF